MCPVQDPDVGVPKIASADELRQNTYVADVRNGGDDSEKVVVGRAPGKAVASLALLSVIALCVVAGIVAVLDGFRTYAGLTPMQIHVGAALIAVPLLGWHVMRHRRRQGPRRTDFAHRHLLQTAGLAAGAGATYLVVEGVGLVTPGPSRRTGGRPVRMQSIPLSYR